MPANFGINSANLKWNPAKIKSYRNCQIVFVSPVDPRRFLEIFVGSKSRQKLHVCIHLKYFIVASKKITDQRNLSIRYNIIDISYRIVLYCRNISVLIDRVKHVRVVKLYAIENI